MSGQNTNSGIEEKYEDLGGVFFPILQQDGSRVLTKIGSGKDAGHIMFLGWLRQHDFSNLRRQRR